MEDLFKPRGATKASQPDAGGAVVRTTPILGIVKDNIDPTRQGRIRVYISDSGAEDSNDSSGWITVGYMMPFFGQTTASGGTSNYGDYTTNPSSYGMWMSPPDINSTVVCIFINGDINYGYYIGCIPQAETLHMVPAIGSNENVILNPGESSSLGGAERLPVSNLNTNNKGLVEKADFLNESRPVHSYIATTFAQQGLVRDPIRGPISSSAQRESPSRVGFGISTPGRPIYEGGYTDETVKNAIGQNNQDTNLKVTSRRAGHTFVMDDGDILGQDQLIRLRSSLGHQILLSDNGQCMTIIHANGQSYIELGKEGTIDMFATNSVNIRTQGDLNLHADNNININAAKQLNILAENMNVNVDKDATFRIGANYNQYTMGQFTVKVDQAMSMFSSGDASYASDSVTFFNGSKINLNTGNASLIPKEVQLIPIVAHSDTLNDTGVGWVAAPGKLLSITSRAPTHMPWTEANQGVDVKVSGNANDELPSNPSAQVAGINSSPTITNNSVPSVNSEIISTVPPVNPISATIDKNTTSALVGQAAVLAQTGPAASVIANGGGVVDIPGTGKIAAIGAFAQTPNQLEAAGILKPGASTVVNSMINAGKTLEQSLTNNLFTGVPGAENLNNFINSQQSQVNATVTNFRQAQTQLTSSGLITGKESSTQIGGLVMSVANSGLDKTLGLAQTLTNGITNNGTLPNSGTLVKGELSPLLGNPAKLISSGNLASNVAATVTGGLGSIAGALKGKTGGGAAGSPSLGGLINAAKGLAAAAFSAVVNGLPKLKPNVPQNIRKIAQDANASTGNTNQGASGLAGLATGLNSIPGAAKVVGNVVNNAKNAVNTVPGASEITKLAGNLTPDIKNKLSSGLTSLTKIASTNLPLGLNNQLNAAISSLSSGGSVPIQLPKVATNTFSRTTITGQMSSMLNNPKIPLPNYGGNPATFNDNPTNQQLQKLIDKNLQISSLYDQLAQQQITTDNLRIAYENAKLSQQPGDPQIAAARTAWLNSLDTLKKINDQVYSLLTSETNLG